MPVPAHGDADGFAVGAASTAPTRMTTMSSAARSQPIRRAVVGSLAVVAATLGAVAAHAQLPPGFMPDTLAPGDLSGFVPIFDGTLRNWDGDPTFWRVENNVIIGESTPEKVVRQNTFLIWRGGTLKDFELKVEARLIGGGNSGIQVRSAEMPEVGRWVLGGYQADMDFDGTFWGMLYEERKRNILALPGTIGRATASERRIVGRLTDPATVRGHSRVNGWNRFHIIARGNTIVVIANDLVTSMVIDDDPRNRALEGLLGLQMHVGPPFRVEFRNLYLKTLP
jgi:hypothetical protein